MSKLIEKRYLAQRHRGTDGFGFYLPEENRLTHNVREGRILSLLRRSNASEVLFHHRYPSSTKNVRNSCHPFSTRDWFKHNYVGVHNGVIWNDEELKKEQEQLGIQYVSEGADGSFNDSEALIYDIARYIEGQVDYLTAEGTIAFIMVQRDTKGNPRNLYFGRNAGNPLMMLKRKNSLTLSSEGKGTPIEVNRLYKYNYKSGEISSEYMFIPSYSKQENWWSGNEGFGIADNDNTWEQGKDGIWRIKDDLKDISTEMDTIGEDFDRMTYNMASIENDAAMEGYVNQIVLRLMNAARQDVRWAIQLGRDEVQKLQDKEDDLYKAVVEDNTATEKEIDDYYRAGDVAFYLGQAIVKMEREVSGKGQMGFRFTPDNSYNGAHNEDRKESVDSNGYAYYPYAD